MFTKQLVLNGLLLLPAMTLFVPKVKAQNTVVISQTGGAGNSAVVSQSGQGNSVVISQSSSAPADSSGAQLGNHASIHVAKGTQTTITQQSGIDRSDGPNSVAISQEGQSTAIISQSLGTGENSIIIQPDSKPNGTKRRNRRP